MKVLNDRFKHTIKSLVGLTELKLLVPLELKDPLGHFAKETNDDVVGSGLRKQTIISRIAFEATSTVFVDQSLETAVLDVQVLLRLLRKSSERRF